MTQILNNSLFHFNKGVNAIVNYYLKNNTHKSYIEAGKKLSILGGQLPKATSESTLFLSGNTQNRISFK